MLISSKDHVINAKVFKGLKKTVNFVKKSRKKLILPKDLNKKGHIFFTGSGLKMLFRQKNAIAARILL